MENLIDGLKATTTPAAAPAAAPASAPSISSYPSSIEVMLGERVYTAEDYPALLERYGKYVVILGRFDDGIVGLIAMTAIVKLGVFGRCMKPVPAARALAYISKADHVMFAGREMILVCSPPLSGNQVLVVADMVMAEESYLSSKFMALEALDAVAGLDAGRATNIVEDTIRFLTAARQSYDARVVQVEPPVGEWNIYTRGGAIPQTDRLTNAIKGFASHSTRVYPPLPPADPAEADALLRIHDLLVRNGMNDLASRLMGVALSTPMFARLCHHESLFDPRRSPPIRVAWDNFGQALLRYLLSEELTHAARRDTNPEPVTRSSPYVLTLDEIVAMKVPHAPLSVAHAFARLNEYVGGYLADLDLSRTLITGSAIAASLIVTDVERRYEMASWAAYCAEVPEPAPPETGAPEAISSGRAITWEEWKDARYGSGYSAYLAAHYPAVKTIPRGRDSYETVCEVARHFGSKLELKTESDGAGGFILTLTATSHNGATIAAKLDVKPGADLDMAIDVATNEEFDAVARGHYEVIRRRHPSAVLKKVGREDPADPRYNWVIVSEGCPGAISTFRAVEMYRANFNHVVTHHVGMVSGAYTALFSRAGEGPKFVVSARLACAMADLATPNYYYFASRKCAPQYVVMKYYARGFGLQAFPRGIVAAMGVVLKDDPVWSGVARDFVFPAAKGKGNFSAYSLPVELATRYAVV